jgi:hypothetical protein
MANYVFNHITIKGSVDELQRFKDHIDEPPEYVRRRIEEQNKRMGLDGAEKEPDPFSPAKQYQGFSFHSFITPSPEKYDVYYSDMNVAIDPDTQEDNWYTWNNRNWGTQSDSSVNDIEFYSDRTGCLTSIHIRFETKWNPPEHLWQALTDQFPDLVFSVWWEEEQIYGQELTLLKGTVTVDKEWDTPSSHTDWADLGREEECVCGWDDNSDEYYDDCPGKTEAEPPILNQYEVVVVTRYLVNAYSDTSAKLAAAAVENDWDMPEGSELVSVNYTHKEETNLIVEDVKNKLEEVN